MESNSPPLIYFWSYRAPFFNIFVTAQKLRRTDFKVVCKYLKVKVTQEVSWVVLGTNMWALYTWPQSYILHQFQIWFTIQIQIQIQCTVT